MASEVGGKPAEYGAHKPSRIRQDLGCNENCKAAGAQGRQLENWPWFSTRMVTGRPTKSTCSGLMGGKLNGVFSIEWGTREGLGNKWIFSRRLLSFQL